MATHASFLSYDIPSESTIPNPSGRLRKIGVRTNLSVWIVPNEKIPYGLLDELTTAGARWDVVRFDASEAEHLALMATEALKREVAQAIKVAQKAEEKAEANTGTVEGKVAYWKKVRTGLNRSVRLLKDAKLAAASFGFEQTKVGFDEAAHQIAALRTAAKAQAKAYAEAVKGLDTKPETKSEIEAAANQMEAKGELTHAAVLHEIAAA